MLLNPGKAHHAPNTCRILILIMVALASSSWKPKSYTASCVPFRSLRCHASRRDRLLPFRQFRQPAKIMVQALGAGSTDLYASSLGTLLLCFASMMVVPLQTSKAVTEGPLRHLLLRTSNTRRLPKLPGSTRGTCTIQVPGMLIESFCSCLVPV